MATKSDQHELIADFQRVARDLGAPPSRDQYHGTRDIPALGRFPKSAVTELFGSWTLFLEAAGFAYQRGRRDRQEIRQEVFEKLRQEVEEKKQLVTPPPISAHLLVIPDLHAPYHHPDAIAFITACHLKYNFDRVILTGDEIDGHAWSFHDHDPDALSPGHELEAAIKALEPLYKLFPRVDVAESNHGSLFYRKAKHHGIPQRVLRSYREIISAPEGWNWHFEIKAQLSNGRSVLVHHAYSANVLGASQQRGMSCIFGHHHSKLSIQYWRSYDEWHFAAFAGSLVDETALAMEYGKNIMHRPLLGVLRVFQGVPFIIPMLLDARGRWNGIVS